MNKDEVSHLASLARLKLTEPELAVLPAELDSIVLYVSTISKIASEDTVTALQVGAVHNIFRADEVTNQPDEYTEAIVAEFPVKRDRFLEVQKILNTDE